MIGFSTLTLGALAAASLAQAAPLTERKAAPSSYAEGYLEPYLTYHTRYLAIGCSGQHKTEFFEDCCRPMLATETLEENRAEKCWPSKEAESSAAAAEPTSDSETDGSKFEWALSNTTDYASSTSVAEAAATEATSTSTSEWVAPTSTWEAPAETKEAKQAAAPAETQAAASSGGDQHHGQATFFYQNGNPGACGNYNSDSTPLVAIQQAWWPNFGSTSDLCGKTVTVQRASTGQTVNAVIADVCPTCVSGDSLDLSVGAFNAIASPDEGSVEINWWFN